MHRKYTVTYQYHYFTIISSISECDHRCESRNAEPEIGTDRSSLTWHNPRVDGYRSGFGLPGAGGLGYLAVPDPFCSVPTRPKAG